VRAADDDDALEFASELLQLAAYDLSTEDDLARGHRLVAAWLMREARAAAALVARHLVQAGERARALPHFVAAARVALAAGQGTRFDALAREAEACGDAVGAVADDGLAALAELRVQAAFWRGAIDEARDLALAARARAASAGATVPWLRATSLVITAAGQLGDNARVAALAAELVATPPSEDAAARDARIVALCRAFTQLEAAGGPHATDVILEALAGGHTPATSPDARAWLARARGTDAARRSFDLTIDAMVDAHRAYVEANDLRSAAQIALYLGSFTTWSGALESARAHVADALRIGERLGADYLVVWARYVLGKIETEDGPLATTSAILEAVAAHPAASPRIRAGALLYHALAAQRAGRCERALALAEEALALARAPMLVRAARAAIVRALVASGRAAEGRVHAAELAPLDLAACIVEHDELVMLARAELALVDDEQAGRRALAQAMDAVAARAATLADPLRRNAYLVRPHLVARTVELARTWNVKNPAGP